MNDKARNTFTERLPYVVGGLLVLQFAGLCVWQVSRGLEKLERQDAFAAAERYARFQGGSGVRPFEALEVEGRWLDDRQFLLENIVMDGRSGYYVLTALDLGGGEPPLLVNRGWIAAEPAPGAALPRERLAVGGTAVNLRGRAGALPRAGMRMGDAVRPGQDWPRRAVFPQIEELEAELGTPLQPFVLLLDAGEPDGFERRWAPEVMAPGRHFAYALQWFAMGAVLAGLLAWHYGKRSLEG